MRRKYTLEMYKSLSFGGALTGIIFAFTHNIFANAGEVLAFGAVTWLIAAYCVWTVIVLLDEKGRDAGLSDHGKGDFNIH